MPWRILTWSHYKRLLSVSNEAARNWYLREASEQMWSYALDAEIVKVADYELEPSYA
jgi:predicted nuclease of restriction endonuclease-like (RecB) superfamily